MLKKTTRKVTVSSRRSKDDGNQLKLLHPVPAVALPELFKKLYYFLYSNSEASRAERIIEELSLILLTKLAYERPSAPVDEWQRYLSGKGAANDVLWATVASSYPTLIDPDRKYGLADSLLRRIFAEMDGVRLSDAPAHVLGEAFQALMGPRLRGDRGQFFTPRAVVEAMVRILAPKPGMKMVDPACGTGGFVSAVVSAAPQKGKSRGCECVGVDKDQDLYRLAGSLLTVAAAVSARVYNFNSLDLQEWQKRFGKNEGLFDIVLTNPPFGTKISVVDEHILSLYDLGRQWVFNEESDRWIRSDLVRQSQDPQILFIELCIRLLVPGGRMGIVLPEGIFGNRGDGYIWDWLRGQGQVVALLDCPRTTFQPGTDTKTNILFFEKGKKKDVAPTRVAVALHCGHDRRGRSTKTDGSAFPNDFLRIADDFHADHPGSWKAVTTFAPHYFVPRYYHRDAAFSNGELALVNGSESATMQALIDRGIIDIRKGHEPGSEAYGTGDIPFVRTSDISNFEISTDPTKAVSEDVYASYAEQQRLRPGDVLMVVDGRYRIGTSALLTENNYRCIVQSHLRVITVLRPDVVTPYELLFALNLPTVKLRLRNLVFIQSTLGTLGRRLMELEVPILHGAGPWTERVENFERTLIERDRLLRTLRSVEGEELEL